jgi:hypothetical protein
MLIVISKCVMCGSPIYGPEFVEARSEELIQVKRTCQCVWYATSCYHYSYPTAPANPTYYTPYPYTNGQINWSGVPTYMQAT